jgi:hypothetical protein
MASPWIISTERAPNDGDTVWIVRLPFFDKPVQANYDATDALFGYNDTNGVSVLIPTYLVYKWRPV